MSLTSLGFNTAGIAVIIAITQVIKSLDTKGKLRRFYILIPLLLAFGVAYLTLETFAWKDYIWSVLSIGSVSSYIYKFGKTTIFGQ